MRKICAALVCAFWFGAAHAAEITVYAAASLADVMTELGRAFQASSGDQVRFSFAASSTLAKQIENGAAVAVFLSADEDWMDYCEKRDLLVAGTRRDLLGNRLVVIEPLATDVHLVLKPGFDLGAALGQDGRLAIGQPDSVPAGKYAREALTHLGMWDGVKDRLAAAESVRAALAYVERGEVPFGIVYATDAAASKSVRVAGVFPADSHKPIVYPAAAVKAGDSPTGRAFLAFVESPANKAVFERYGFEIR